MAFQIKALQSNQFQKYFGKTDDELQALGAKAYIALAKPGFPCRLTLTDADPGTRLILLNYEHLPVESPYRSSHAIFVSDGVQERRVEADTIPDYIASRYVSVRSYDKAGMMVDGVAIDGSEASSVFNRMFENPSVEYIHVHTAARGCYLAAVERAA